MTQTEANKSKDPQFQSRMRELADLVERAESIKDPAAREATAQIVQTMMEFHGAGLQVILHRLADAGALGQSIIDDLAQDDLASSLLLLYGLHPVDTETRVQAALQKVRPFLTSHGSNVELQRITEDGAVHLLWHQDGHSCASSTSTFQQTIEQAIYDKAPDVTAIHIQGLDQAPAHADGFAPVELLIHGRHSGSANGKPF